MLQDPALNGSQGTFRANKELKSISADNDDEAIQEFLNGYKQTPTTLRAYSKELNRFLIWTALYLKKPISSMNRDDFNRYVEFIKNPDPQWCGAKVPRENEGWKPFVGPLAESGQRVAIASINSMMNWLVNAGYMSGNPMGLIRKPVTKDDNFEKVVRVLDDDMWMAVKVTIESLPRETQLQVYRYERFRFLMSTFVMLASRINELCNIRMGHFRDTPSGWFWFVNGKGDKYSNVAMPPDMMEALMRWREYLGLSPLPNPDEKYPALPFSDRLGRPNLNSEAITPRRVNQLLKELFNLAADQLKEGGQEVKAIKLKKASAHWLRHTSLTQKLHAGIPREYVQQEGRHKDIRTTNRYLHEEEDKRSKESVKHSLK